jgi:hypothetical protein
MARGKKEWTFRGGDGFGTRTLNMDEIRSVGRIAWAKWGVHQDGLSPRDLVSLAYAEGIWHGAMLMERRILAAQEAKEDQPQ